jgi:hypothetical protein
VVALAGLAPVAHGGVYGAVAEAAIALAIAGLFLYVWLRERRRGDRPIAEIRDDD